MPKSASKHENTDYLELNDFMGGMNQGAPPTQIANNECSLARNIFFDRHQGKPRTRYPITKYSNSAVNPVAPLDGIFFWEDTWFLTAAQHLFYLDTSLDPTEITGGLNSSNRPTFAPYNSKLVIGSGGTLQSVSSCVTTWCLSDVTNAPLGKFVFERYSRLVSAGNSDYPDRINEGTYTDDTTWGASDYGDVGYNDGTDIIGITEAYEGLYIVFKRGDSGIKTYYALSLSSTDPKARCIAPANAAYVHAGVVSAEGIIYVLEEHVISALKGEDAQGKIIYDNSPGLKLGVKFSATSSAWAITYPRDSQVWFFPDPLSSIAYIYHYRIDAWSEFDFGDRKIYSGFYNPSDGFLYLGCDDGFIYKYDHTSTTFEDTDGAYEQRFKTKIFTQPISEVNIKAPLLVWHNLAAGAGTVYVKKNYGKSTVMEESITLSNPSPYVYDTQASGSDELYVYDTQEGGDNETYVYPSSYDDYRFQYNMDVNNFQFDIKITSGGLGVERIATEISSGRKFN